MLRSVWVSRAEVACGEKRLDLADAAESGEYRGAEWGKPHLIQQDDLRRFEDGPGDGHPLLLPSAQLQTPLPHLRVVTCKRRWLQLQVTLLKME